jgi:MoxR-like ATPase
LPGLAKTRAIKSLAANFEVEFRRIQFTQGLLPSDVTGTEVYYELILADEINRAPAKVQAALLEAAAVKQVAVA